MSPQETELYQSQAMQNLLMATLLTSALTFCATTLVQASTTDKAKQECDPNYTGACIQPYSKGDVDCGEIRDRNFRSIGSDPHRLDRDKDGIACEQR